MKKCFICKKVIISDTKWLCSPECTELYHKQRLDKELAKPFVHYCPNCKTPIGYIKKAYYIKAVETKKICGGCDTVKWFEKAKKSCRYNLKACLLMNDLNKRGYNFIHAENGGEYYINRGRGFFLDGYDPVKNIVFEYDESHHITEVENDKLREHSIFRYFEDENIKIRFIRYDATFNKFYEVFDNFYDKHGQLIKH